MCPVVHPFLFATVGRKIDALNLKARWAMWADLMINRLLVRMTKFGHIESKRVNGRSRGVVLLDIVASMLDKVRS